MPLEIFQLLRSYEQYDTVYPQQMFFGVPIQDNSGDQSLVDPDESPEVGELKIDISDVRDLHDVGDG